MGLKDKRIAVISENRYEWAISYLSVITGTGVVVPLDRQLPEREVENCIRRAEVSAIIYSNKLSETITEIGKNIELIKINMDITENEEDVYSLKKLLEKGKELIKNGDKRFERVIINVNEMASLLFTSGTTAESKAVMLSHKNICFNIHEQCKMIEITPEDTFLSVLPLHHVYECTCGFLTPIYRGASVAYCDGLRHIQKNLKEAKVSVFLGVPLIFETIYKKIWEGIEKQGKKDLVKKW